MKYETKQKLNKAIENWADANFPKLFPDPEDYEQLWIARNDKKNQLRSDIVGAMLSDRNVSKILADAVGNEDFSEMVDAVDERLFDLIEAAMD